MTDETDVNERIQNLQEQMRMLQAQLPGPAVQDQLTRLQSLLYELRGPIRRSRTPFVEPVALPRDLPQGESLVFDTFVRFHTSLLAYAGDVTREQWILLMNAAAAMTAASYSQQGGGSDGSTVRH